MDTVVLCYNKTEVCLCAGLPLLRPVFDRAAALNPVPGIPAERSDRHGGAWRQEPAGLTAADLCTGGWSSCQQNHPPTYCLHTPHPTQIMCLSTKRQKQSPLTSRDKSKISQRPTGAGLRCHQSLWTEKQFYILPFILINNQLFLSAQWLDLPPFSVKVAGLPPGPSVRGLHVLRVHSWGFLPLTTNVDVRFSRWEGQLHNDNIYSV